MQNTKDPIMEYLALFNQIDKHFDKILGLEKFLPYNEKIKRLCESNYNISWFVNLHKYELKFFGELRNHITHGIKLDGHNYAIPSNYALEKIRKMSKNLKKPPSGFDVFKKEVFFCNKKDKLDNILEIMKNNGYTHVPVYDNFYKFVGILNLNNIAYYLSDIITNKKDIKNILVKNVLEKYNDIDYLFVSKKSSIFEIDEIFTIKKRHKKPLSCILITYHGKENEKLLGIITSGDIAIVDNYIVH